MKQKNKFFNIIERIEYLRNLLKLNKSRFSSDIGMKPQTYNNFIGAQGSKPNVELISGIVNKFGVNPLWLLNGTGAIFLDEQKSPDYRGLTQPGILGTRERGAIAQGPEAMAAFERELKELEPLIDQVEGRIKTMEQVHMPILDRYIGLVKRYFELDPLSAIEEFKEYLKRVGVRVGNQKKEV